MIEEILQTGLTPIYKDDLPGEAEITLADISMGQALGWEPRVDIREGLKRSIGYIKDKVMYVALDRQECSAEPLLA